MLRWAVRAGVENEKMGKILGGNSIKYACKG
jgi:hypothetical protein